MTTPQTELEALELEVRTLTAQVAQFKRDESIILDLYQNLTGETPRDVQFNAFCIGYKAAHTWIDNGTYRQTKRPYWLDSKTVRFVSVRFVGIIRHLKIHTQHFNIGTIQ